MYNVQLGIAAAASRQVTDSLDRSIVVFPRMRVHLNVPRSMRRYSFLVSGWHFPNLVGFNLRPALCTAMSAVSRLHLFLDACRGLEAAEALSSSAKSGANIILRLSTWHEGIQANQTGSAFNVVTRATLLAKHAILRKGSSKELSRTQAETTETVISSRGNTEVPALDKTLTPHFVRVGNHFSRDKNGPASTYYDATLKSRHAD
ncbi:uncharacterized protein HD556DRAFT_1312295 [Suillus plorans]|uniref:Uncharacterized protein n=1 Tax=Suillus plorans TaxID=116603 RepID=A0A9P7DDH7_9AGAM|nr:uncharacterized protein HD556DRAFT_1312295 [Suillus plorans]KAG1788013.1 hypothetical protein HD556DRAFT_1312295 [Suillus plorans]